MKNTTIILILGIFLFSATSIFAQPDPSDTNSKTQTTTTTTTTSNNNSSNDPMGCQRQGPRKGQGKARDVNNRQGRSQGRVQQGNRTPKVHNRGGNGQRATNTRKDYTSCKSNKSVGRGHYKARVAGQGNAKGVGHRRPIKFDERN